jgi:integrase
MPLTSLILKSSKRRGKTYRLFDSMGLYIEVSPAGGRWWRYKYRFGGKEKRLSFGVYPEVSLKEARERRDEARGQIRNRIDPGEARRAHKLASATSSTNSFELVAREWFLTKSKGWAATHSSKILQRLERDVFPWLGRRPIAQTSAVEVLAVLRRIEGRGAIETAHRALQNCSQVFRYAVSTGRAERDPCSDLRGALQPVRGTHFAALTEPHDVAGLLRALDTYQGSLVVQCALKLAPLVFVRPGELRSAHWSDVDLDAAEWRYNVSKTATAHIVPLSVQAVTVLRELKPVTGGYTYVFPSARSSKRPMSDNAVLSALRRLGIEKEVMSGHGFRAMARTILDEVLGFRVELIEHQLAHAVRDPTGRAYNRTVHLPERRKMMQAWADYLDQLKVAGTAAVVKKAA